MKKLPQKRVGFPSAGGAKGTGSAATSSVQKFDHFITKGTQWGNSPLDDNEMTLYKKLTFWSKQRKEKIMIYYLQYKWSPKQAIIR